MTPKLGPRKDGQFGKQTTGHYAYLVLIGRILPERVSNESSLDVARVIAYLES